MEDWERMWEDNIKMRVGEVVWMNLVWIELVYNHVIMDDFGDTIAILLVTAVWKLLANYYL
jgi:hypothetical protein